MPTSVILTLLMAALLLATPSLQKPIFLGKMPIGSPGSYSQDSAYQHNLEIVLSTLESSASSYSSASTGNGTDTVYGSYYCRLDVSNEECTACVDAAANQIVSGVNNSKEAIVWYDICTLFYLTNSSRLDALDLEQFPHLWLVDAKTNVTDPESFYLVAAETLNRVINVSAYGEWSDGYATTEANISAFTTLYSLAECSPDTVGLLCERCLRRALHEYALWFKDNTEMAIFYATCQLRYSVVAPFYDVSLSTPSTYAPPPTDHPQPQGNMSVGRRCGRIMQMAFRIALITIILLMK